MKVTFGQKVMNSLPVTAREILMQPSMVCSVKFMPKTKDTPTTHSNRFNDAVVLVVPCNELANTGRVGCPHRPPVKCDQMFKCHIEATKAPQPADGSYYDGNEYQTVNVNAELVDGNSVSASELMSTYNLGTYIPQDISSAIQHAIKSIAVDMMQAPKD